jgi:hypothetical protein
VSPRSVAVVFAFAAIGLTLAQDAFPGRPWFHEWPYLTLLAIALGVLISHAWSVRGRFALALAGAIVVATAGLVAGLIGPDTVTVSGAPGSVIPVPDLGAAAFFGPADASTIDRGEATLTLRRRGGGPIVVGRRPIPLDLSVVVAEARPAAYVVARNARGERLTVTQPDNPSFLSPVLMFRRTQTIRDRTVPYDTFAVPGSHRIVHALVFTAADLASLRGSTSGEGGIVLSVSDDRGAQLGLAIAPQGREVAAGDLRLTLTLGSYPQLIVAAAPQPLALIGGTTLFLLAGAWTLQAGVWPFRMKSRSV